jgi:hypothetical protein
MSMVFSNLDILDNIIPLLDPKSLQNIFISCKSHYAMFNDNSTYLKHKLMQSLIKHLNINIIIESADNQHLYSQLNSLYKYFYYHLDSYIVDYVIFLIEKKVQNKRLIHQLLGLCHYPNEFRQKQKENRYEISYVDMQYILIHGDIDIVVNIIDKYYLTPEILFSVLQDIVTQTQSQHKINILVKYFMYKHVFRTMNQDAAMFFHLILGILIKNKRNSAFKLIIKRKNKYVRHRIFDYRYLYNTCIAEDNLEILKLIHDDNDNFGQDRVLIEHSSLKSLFQKGRLDCLEFVLESLLGTHINLPLYTKSMCAGLCKQTKLRDRHLTILKSYLTSENFEMILGKHLDCLKL